MTNVVNFIIITHANSVGQRGQDVQVRLIVCPEHNSQTIETKDPKVFKLGIGNDLGIS